VPLGFGDMPHKDFGGIAATGFGQAHAAIPFLQVLIVVMFRL
jgi:hypothetical protein